MNLDGEKELEVDPRSGPYLLEKGSDIKIKNAVLEILIIPGLKSFIESGNNAKKESLDNEERFKCEHCEVTTKSKLYLKLHVEKIHVIDELQCKDCSYKAKDKDILKGHVMTKHLPMDVQQHCREIDCDFKCGSLNDLQLHTVASHDSSLCKFCGETYSSEQYLRQHIDEKHIFDSETHLKREISANSKLEPPAKHEKNFRRRGKHSDKKC